MNSRAAKPTPSSEPPAETSAQESRTLVIVRSLPRKKTSKRQKMEIGSCNYADQGALGTTTCEVENQETVSALQSECEDLRTRSTDGGGQEEMDVLAQAKTVNLPFLQVFVRVKPSAI